MQIVDNHPQRYFKEGIRLAEEGEWDLLLERLDMDMSIARHKDHYGMLPLHWACTEDDVPSNVLKRLIDAYPEGALTKNNAQMLPLHIAIRARALPRSLMILCDAHPSSAVVETNQKKSPLQLAEEVGLNDESLEILRQAELNYINADHSMTEQKRKNDLDGMDKHAINPEDNNQHDIHLLHSMQQDLGEDNLRRSTMSQGTTDDRITNSDEPTSADSDRGPIAGNYKDSSIHIRDADRCYVCSKCFSMFRKKYQCHSCRKSVCKKHVAGSVSNSNNYSKRFICYTCFDLLENGKMKSLQNVQLCRFSSSSNEQSSRSSGEASSHPSPSRQKELKQNRFSMDDDNSTAEQVLMLQERITTVENSKARMEVQLFDLEKLQAETMLLLTESMTRIAELEMKIHASNSKVESNTDDVFFDAHALSNS